ncbi:MAG: FadR/GntR family transcriptional regulator [Burkholderiaceae bacterium]|nr:FadR/GntR family transcriptional regulator [Burkholderiaceae bacterium]
MPATSLNDDAASAPAPGDDTPLVTRLLEFLRARRFEPGERLPPQRVLATRLGVGRNALREAIATLSALRVVESKPNTGGIYLKDIAAESSFETIIMLSELGTAPSAQEVVDMMEVRQNLELSAVRLACRRRTDADLAAMARVLAQTEETLNKGGNIADLDQSFHMLLASASQNGVLVRMLHAFYRLSLARRRIYFANIEAARASAADHSALIAALEKRDEDAGQKLMTHHIGSAMRYWRETLGGAAQLESEAVAR